MIAVGNTAHFSPLLYKFSGHALAVIINGHEGVILAPQINTLCLFDLSFGVLIAKPGTVLITKILLGFRIDQTKRPDIGKNPFIRGIISALHPGNQKLSRQTPAIMLGAEFLVIFTRFVKTLGFVDLFVCRLADIHAPRRVGFALLIFSARNFIALIRLLGIGMGGIVPCAGFTRKI